jgi:hypothetical protein
MKNKTHWLKSPNKNYLGHWDLPDGQDLVLTIESAQWEEVENPTLKPADKIQKKRVIRFKEKDVKPLICNETNAASILSSTGVKFMEDTKNVKIALYVATIMDRRTKSPIDCIRIRNEKPANPELTPNDKYNWDNSVKALTEGYTIAQILKRFTLSDANKDLLLTEATQLELNNEANNS